MTAPITVLMPVRNAAVTLAECLDSIQTQTHDDFELLIVDDHSTDNSDALIKPRGQRDPRIRLVRNPGHGLISALNFGLQQARGTLIARMDADDVMTDSRLQRQFQHLSKHSETVVLGTRVSVYPQPSDGFAEYLRWQNACLSAEDLCTEIFVEAPFAHPSVMFRRDVILQAGGYRDGDYPEDYELWLRLHQLGHRMEKLNETLLAWQDLPDRLSRSHPRYRRMAFDALRAHYLQQDPRLQRHRDNFVIWGAGRRTRQRCAHLLDTGLRPTAWIDIDPRKIGNKLDGAPVVEPDWLIENRCFVLGYVANHGAREQIQHWLTRNGYQRGSDFLMVG